MPDQEMKQALEKLVDTQPLQGSAYKFISRCKMCGWQTMQNKEDDGKKLVVSHAAVHWPELSAAKNQQEQASQPSAAGGGPSSQEKGKQEGGQDAGNGGRSGGSGDVGRSSGGRSEPSAQPSGQQTGAQRGIGGPTSPSRP